MPVTLPPLSRTSASGLSWRKIWAAKARISATPKAFSMVSTLPVPAIAGLVMSAASPSPASATEVVSVNGETVPATIVRSAVFAMVRVNSVPLKKPPIALSSPAATSPSVSAPPTS